MFDYDLVLCCALKSLRLELNATTVVIALVFTLNYAQYCNKIDLVHADITFFDCDVIHPNDVTLMMVDVKNA